MKSFLALIILLIPLQSMPQQSNSQLAENSKNEILKTDIAFNDLCQKDGLAKAFIDFAADEVILMRQNQLPIIGKDALKERYKSFKSRPKLTWYPVKADVSSSGDLGYTFGNWELVGKTPDGKDTTSYGVYVSIWKKQKDGNWKYVFDGGNDTPPLFKK